ncbi:DNA topoisomerase IB [Sphingomonas donggukensis]|uniref:DNA topoisomerase n=1 Tax=Sphingomonas donggukensis TaxID=2949093 RepID=A0ABY4TSW7_9SPHN|nr:DNA topoisomerase IB [Sphingomonas donggukensis]URW75503.1 DNA topoisomerase IB [Sphingomonas donggukensis]
MARLSYSDDSAPGITRKKAGHGWGYWDADGKRITDRDEIDRLNAIGLPPAYRDAWFCPNPNGHIQAVGWDEKGRKQYRYHLDFRAKQDSAKYEGCATFGRKLPKLRAQVEADLKLSGLSREKAVAAVVRLLDIGHIRVGNEGYAKSNNSFGATTLRNRHVKVAGNALKLKFRAKSGKERVMTITDRSLTRFVKKCQDLPGQHLFQWLDAEGEPHPVSSSDVNEYIRASMDDDFTAKHFRTWSASVMAFEALVEADKDIGLNTMLEPVTEALGNTPAIARKSYVHPMLIDIVKKGDQSALRARALPRTATHLSRTERGLIALLDSSAKEKRALKLAA